MDIYRAARIEQLRARDARVWDGTDWVPQTERVVPEWRDSDWTLRDDPRTDTTVRFEFRTPKHATGTVKHVYRRGRFVGTIRRIPEGWTSDAAPGVVVKDRLELAQSLLALKRGAAMPTLNTAQSAPKPAPQPIKPRGALMSTERINRHVTNYPNMPRFGADI